MTTGYIKLHRKFLSSELWERMPYSDGKLWQWLLLNANWEDNPERNLKAGQLSFSLRFIRRAMTWKDGRGKEHKPTIRTIRRHLEGLKKAGNLSILLSSNGSEVGHSNGLQEQMIITICNWSTYQHVESEVGHSDGSEVVPRWATNQRSKEVKKTTEEGDTRVRARESNVIIHKEPSVKPWERPEDELLPAHDDFDLQDMVQQYTTFLTENQRQPPPVTPKVINALHRDPDIAEAYGRQLTKYEVADILMEQVHSRYPLKITQFWDENPKQGNLPFWESSLLISQRRTERNRAKAQGNKF